MTECQVVADVLDEDGKRLKGLDFDAFGCLSHLENALKLRDDPFLEEVAAGRYHALVGRG